MTNEEVVILTHKALQHCPENGIFNLLDAVKESLSGEQDTSEVLEIANKVRVIFLQKYGQQDSYKSSWLMTLNEEGVKLKRQPLPAEVHI